MHEGASSPLESVALSRVGLAPRRRRNPINISNALKGQSSLIENLNLRTSLSNRLRDSIDTNTSTTAASGPDSSPPSKTSLPSAAPHASSVAQSSQLEGGNISNKIATNNLGSSTDKSMVSREKPDHLISRNM